MADFTDSILESTEVIKEIPPYNIDVLPAAQSQVRSVPCTLRAIRLLCIHCYHHVH